MKKEKKQSNGRMVLKIAILFFVTISSCVDEGENDSNAKDEENNSELLNKDREECWGLNIDDCQINALCETVSAKIVDEENSCIGGLEVVGCAPANNDCILEQTICAEMRSGTEYMIENGCAKSLETQGEYELTECENISVTNECQADSASCWEETIEECDDREECSVMIATKVDLVNECRNEPEEVGCRPKSFKEANCGDDAMFCVQDTNEDIWIFGSSCYVPGWKEIQDYDSWRCVDMVAFDNCD